MLGIAIYIWFRFEWQFGVGALVTLFHDVAMVLGFFALTQLQVDLNIVAAFLAIVGYSLNDTVVIYDRIRENLRKYRKMEIVSLLNFSLNETLSRTIVTSLSIMLALAVLLVARPRRAVRPDRSPSCSARSSAPIRRSTFRRRRWSGWASSPTASSRRRGQDDGHGRSVPPKAAFSSQRKPAWPSLRPALGKSHGEQDPYRGAVAAARNPASRRRLRRQQGRRATPPMSRATSTRSTAWPRSGSTRATMRRRPSCSTRSSASTPIRSGPAGRS